MTKEEKLSQLQMIEQSLQSILVQKQQFQSQLSEIESALKELNNSSESYKIIGNIMVNVKKEELKKDLEDKNNKLNLRIKNIEKQEETIKTKAEGLQSEIMKDLKE